MPGFADFVLLVLALLSVSFVVGVGLALAWRFVNRDK